MERLFLLLITTVGTRLAGNMDSLMKIEACNNLNCDSSNKSVCGIRNEIGAVRLRLFANECALLKYGCSVQNKNAYGLISMEYCWRSDIINTDADTPRNEILTHNLEITHNLDNNSECVIKCNYLHKNLTCGIRQDGEGFRVKLFENACELVKYNCNTTLPFIRTDTLICQNTLETHNNSISNTINAETYDTAGDYTLQNSKSIIVVDGSMLGKVSEANETIENFFAATHVFDLPLKEMDQNQFNARRMIMKSLGPVKVFQPWITIPKKIKTDFHHLPTLSTCYHKCPTQCPETYSPVCGVPGILAREPSIMFQNHCYMDVAQCKMYWENKSSTAISSSYIESSFLFCLGDQLNGMYRFLPLVKTLQHMGRLKKKGKFRYRLNNMRFFNNHAYKEPKLMG